ncbi:hypothetical protein [Chryseobacterium gossypii]|uniref:hypothetical protein n=1 Tax=Chryseobacterium gossypii TaxID=3231602 RepID=UPI003523F43E
MIVIYTEGNDITSNLDIDWISALYSGEIKRVNTDYFAMPKDEDYHIDINESIPVKSIWY